MPKCFQIELKLRKHTHPKENDGKVEHPEAAKQTSVKMTYAGMKDWRNWVNITCSSLLGNKLSKHLTLADKEQNFNVNKQN